MRAGDRVPPQRRRVKPEQPTVGRTLRRVSLALALLTAGAILVLTLMPRSPGAACVAGLPCAVGHLALFAVLGASLSGWYATSAYARRSPARTLLMLVLALWIFAAADELAQPYVGRVADLDDWMLDMVGALIGLFGGGAALRFARRYLGSRR